MYKFSSTVFLPVSSMPFCFTYVNIWNSFFHFVHLNEAFHLLFLPCNLFCQKPCNDGKSGNSNEYNHMDIRSEDFILKTASCPSPPSANKISSVSDAPNISCTFRHCVPLSKEANSQDEIAVSQVTIEAKGFQTDKSDREQPFQDNPPFKISNVVNSYLSQEKSVLTKRTDELMQSENADTSQITDVQASQNYPRHVPVHILDGSLGLTAQNISPEMPTDGVNVHKKLFMNPASSGISEHYSNASRSSVHQSFPSYHPTFTPTQNQDDYQLQISATFSSLIVSALSQNPAAYAAASFAATLWPSVNMEASIEPSTTSAGAFQPSLGSSTPSMAAIAAATVAAANAWWAAHGLLPLCAPFQPGFTCSPSSAIPMDSSQCKAVNSERREKSPDPGLGGQQLEPECSEALHEQPSDSEASECAKLNAGSETAKVEDTTELQDENKAKNKKLVDRSSCGSNTPSSSEVEADALEKHATGMEEKHTKDTEEQEDVDVILPVGGDPFSRRIRSITTNINDSWKEVSEEVLGNSVFI